MDEGIALVQALTQHGAQALDVAGREIGHVAEIRLGLDDGVEIAAIGDVDGERPGLRPKFRKVDLQPGRMQERRHIGDAHALDMLASHFIGRIDPAGRGIEAQRSGLGRPDQAAFQRHGDGADGAMAAHRQAAAGLDEQDAEVAVVARRRHQDAARHLVVAARLEHQPGADPVERGQEMLPPRAHRRPGQRRRPARHHAHRVAAGMRVDAEESSAVHRRLPREVSQFGILPNRRPGCPPLAGWRLPLARRRRSAKDHRHICE